MIEVIMAATLLVQGGQSPSPGRAHEGDWYMADTTDNNTGKREVYAFQTRLSRDDPDFVTLTLRCSKGKPTLFVEWHDLTFPDETVLTIGPVDAPEVGPAGESYVFAKSEDVLEGGLKASAKTSAEIVSAIGASKYVSLTARPSTGSRTVGIEVAGTPGAWSRVVRHCPVKIVPTPPV